VKKKIKTGDGRQEGRENLQGKREKECNKRNGLHEGQKKGRGDFEAGRKRDHGQGTECSAGQEKNIRLAEQCRQEEIGYRGLEVGKLYGEETGGGHEWGNYERDSGSEAFGSIGILGSLRKSDEANRRWETTREGTGRA